MKHIILLSDEAVKATEIRDLVKGIDSIKMDVVPDVTSLATLVQQRAPHIILIHLANPDPGYVDHIKDIRKDLNIDKVPVMILSVIPSVDEIINLAR